jgi:homoserine O-succinyltransferase/O-acetyltransferase
MLVMMDETRTPTHWALRNHSTAMPLIANCGPDADRINVALVNNMPDAALEDTEAQFFDLLNSAAGEIPVRLWLYSLPGIPRGERGKEHLNRFYLDIADLLNSRFDGVIVTGTEPRQSDLRKEPYWGILTEVLQWAEHNTNSTLLSCLAAHAGVLHSDGIERHPLGDKKFGVFSEAKVSDHPLTGRTSDPMQFPHSRWNEVREDALISSGYTVLTKSAQAGVNLFVKQKGKSLFVHFQGHPEYEAGTLLKEYRRDVKRFLRKERETYPSLPCGYFNDTATKVLHEFQNTALAHRNEQLIAAFPESVVANSTPSAWHSVAVGIYRNWLQDIASKRTDISAPAPNVRVGLG